MLLCVVSRKINHPPLYAYIVELKQFIKSFINHCDYMYNSKVISPRWLIYKQLTVRSNENKFESNLFWFNYKQLETTRRNKIKAIAIDENIQSRNA